MAVEQVGNLLKSQAVLWIAPYGEALPDETSVAAGGSWGGNWTKAGWTKEPLAFQYEYEEAEMGIEQALGAIDREKSGESVTMETVLAEATALSLALASGGASGDVTETSAGAGQVAFEELEVGNEGELTKYAVGFEGSKFDSSGNELPVRVFLTRATIAINGELEFSQKSDDYVGVPIQIKALADPGNSMKLFKWQRVTAPASS